MMGLGGDRPWRIRMPHHQIRVRPHRNRSLTRSQSEQPSYLCAGHLDKTTQVQLPSLHPMRIKQRHSILQGGDPIGNLGKVRPTHLLLSLEIKRRVIGRQGMNQSLLQSVPQHRLILLLPQRWRHDKLRALKVRPLGKCFISHQILD